VVGLTDQGTELLEANRQRRNEWLAVRLEKLTEAERATLRTAIPILSKIAET
jgi:DNA-binding MarR family transcriptional regulator